MDCANAKLLYKLAKQTRAIIILMHLFCFVIRMDNGKLLKYIRCCNNNHNTNNNNNHHHDHYWRSASCCCCCWFDVSSEIDKRLPIDSCCWCWMKTSNETTTKEAYVTWELGFCIFNVLIF